MTGAAPFAIVLRCPQCGTELLGHDADRAWVCVSCAHVWEVVGRELAARPYRVWRLDAGGPAVWLPFWRVQFRAEIECDDAHVRETVEQVAARGGAWVRAFWLDGAFQMGDPGQALTDTDTDETLASDRLPAITGIRISSAEAVRLAELFVLASADKIADVSPVTLRLHVQETALVAVPFRDDGRDVVCVTDGHAFRKAAIPDLG